MDSENTTSVNLTTQRRRLSPKKWNDYIAAYLMIAPLSLGLVIFYIIPFFQSLYYSFTNMQVFGPSTWIGLANFKRMITDQSLMQAISNSFIYTIISVPISILIALVLAVLLNVNIRGRSIYRTLLFLPCITMPAAIAMVWKWFYSTSYGLFNGFLHIFGISGQAWLVDPKIVLYSVIVVAIWSSVGYNMVILLAGLQGISPQYYEASEIDGAAKFKQFFSITLPLLTPTMFFVLVMAIMSALQAFDIIFMMIPYDSMVINNVEPLVYIFYRNAFVFNDKGYASAIAILIFVIIMAITLLQMKLQKKWVNYD